MFSKKNIIFLLILSLAIFLSLIVSIKRIIIENNNNNIEVAIDFQKFEKICYSEGSDIYSGFQILLKSGINSVLIHEDTINSLSASGHISVLSGSELLKNIRSLALLNPLLKTVIEKKGIRPNYTYIITSDQKIHDRIFGELKIRFKDDELKTSVTTENLSADAASEIEPLYMISINSTSFDLYNLGLGFNQKNLSFFQNLGFSIFLGLANSNFLTINQIDRLLETIQNIPNLSGILIEGGVVLGYSATDHKNAEHFGRKIAELSKIKAKFALVEFEKIINLDKISAYLSHMTIKAHRLSSTKTPAPADTEEHDKIIKRFVTAVRERNVKLVIFEGMSEKMRGVSKNLLMQNCDFLQNLVQKIKENGFNIKSSSAFESDLATPIIIIIISWGILCLYILFFEHIFKMPRKISYLVLIVFMAFVLIFALKWYNTYAMTVYRQVVSFGISILICLIPVIYKVKIDKAINESANFYPVFYRSVFSLLYVLFFTGLFSTFIVGILSSVEFINNVETYRAVRLTWILSLLFTLSLSIRTEHLTKKFKEFVNEPVKIYQLCILLLLPLAALPYFYIFNLNGGFNGPAFVKYDSGFFESIFGISPNINEYLIGYPLLTLFYYLNYKKIKTFNPILITIGTLGPISLINSICHIHVPLYLTFIKSISGIAIGIVYGAFLCSIVEFGLTHYRKETDSTAL